MTQLDPRWSDLVRPLATDIWTRREALGLSRRSVAILAGMDEKSVKNLEYGRRVNLETAALMGLAAIAVSALTNGGDYLDEAQTRLLEEWTALYNAGIVPQRPPRATL